MIMKANRKRENSSSQLGTLRGRPGYSRLTCRKFFRKLTLCLVPSMPHHIISGQTVTQGSVCTGCSRPQPLCLQERACHWGIDPQVGKKRLKNIKHSLNHKYRKKMSVIVRDMHGGWFSKFFTSECHPNGHLLPTEFPLQSPPENRVLKAF